MNRIQINQELQALDVQIKAQDFDNNGNPCDREHSASLMKREGELFDMLLELDTKEKNGPKGLTVNVLVRADGSDCTNNGITSKVKRIVIVGEGIPKLDAVPEGEVYLELVKREMFGKVYFHAAPRGDEFNPGNRGMAGGNFVYSSDSRFNDICNYPVSVHDRFEK